VRGYIEHDSRNCYMGEHSNRGSVEYMCPVYLALRRTRLKHIMRARRFDEFMERTRHGA